MHVVLPLVTCFIGSSARSFQAVHQKLELTLCALGVLISAIIRVIIVTDHASALRSNIPLLNTVLLLVMSGHEHVEYMHVHTQHWLAYLQTSLCSVEDMHVPYTGGKLTDAGCAGASRE